MSLESLQGAIAENLRVRGVYSRLETALLAEISLALLGVAELQARCAELTAEYVLAF